MCIKSVEDFWAPRIMKNRKDMNLIVYDTSKFTFIH